jgi:hypothetical protein
VFQKVKKYVWHNVDPPYTHTLSRIIWILDFFRLKVRNDTLLYSSFHSSQCDSNANGPNPFTMCKFPFVYKGQVWKIHETETQLIGKISFNEINFIGIYLYTSIIEVLHSIILIFYIMCKKLRCFILNKANFQNNNFPVCGRIHWILFSVEIISCFSI